MLFLRVCVVFHCRFLGGSALTAAFCKYVIILKQILQFVLWNLRFVAESLYRVSTAKYHEVPCDHVSST